MNSMERKSRFNRSFKSICPICGKVVDIEMSATCKIKIGNHEKDLKMIACTPMTTNYLLYCHDKLMINCKYVSELEFCKLLFDIGCRMHNVFFTVMPTEITTLFGVGKNDTTYHDETCQYSEPFISFSPTSDTSGITFGTLISIINDIMSNCKYDKVKVFTTDLGNEYDEDGNIMPESYEPVLDDRFDSRVINITIILKDRSDIEEYRACMNQFSIFYSELIKRIKEVQNNG